MPKKLKAIFLFLSVILASDLFAAEKQVRVIIDRAPIYAENNIYSYKIEIVKKGTILIVFETGQPMLEWFYVRYHSQRWKSVVTGFIQASMIEEITDKPKEEPKEEQIEPKPKPQITEPKPKKEKIEPKPPEVPKKVKEEKEVREEEPPKVSEEEILVASSVLPHKLLPLPQVKEKKEEPRVFMYIETRPPQEKMTIPQREQIREDVQPKIEKPEAKPAKVKPKVEQVIVTERVGASPIPPSTSYSLTPIKVEEVPRVFLSVETKPMATESSQKQVVPQIATERPKRPKKPRHPSELYLFTMSLGYGPSGGSGLGGFLQLNTKMGLSLHFGAGYYPTSYYYSEYKWVKNEVLYSAGIKYYFPFKNNRIRAYLDLQYGGVSVEAVRLVTGIWYYEYIYENIQKTLYGPSILAGIELKLGSIGLNGAIGLSYSTTEWDYWERDYFLTADVGLLIYLW